MIIRGLIIRNIISQNNILRRKIALNISYQTLKLLIMEISCIVFFGCTGLRESQKIENDIALVFPWTDDYATLTTTDGQVYYEAWERGYADDVDELLGYVFPETVIYEKDTINILVGIVTTGRILKVVVLSVIHNIPRDFLLQFEGKGPQDSFEIVRNTEDVLIVPSKIKPISGNIEISQMIADSVKEALLSANLTTARY